MDNNYESDPDRDLRYPHTPTAPQIQYSFCDYQKMKKTEAEYIKKTHCELQRASDNRQAGDRNRLAELYMKKPPCPYCLHNNRIPPLDFKPMSTRRLPTALQQNRTTRTSISKYDDNMHENMMSSKHLAIKNENRSSEKLPKSPENNHVRSTAVDDIDEKSFKSQKSRKSLMTAKELRQSVHDRVKLYELVDETLKDLNVTESERRDVKELAEFQKDNKDAMTDTKEDAFALYKTPKLAIDEFIEPVMDSSLTGTIFRRVQFMSLQNRQQELALMKDINELPQKLEQMLKNDT